MMTAILVDDEEKSLKNLSILLTDHCDGVKIINTASNALEAVKIIMTEKPDLVFLDVQKCPVIMASTFLNILRKPPQPLFSLPLTRIMPLTLLRNGAFDYLLKAHR